MNIHKIITLASLAANRKTAAHLLTHILLDAKDGKLTATAFGGDVRVCAWCDYAGKDFTALAPGQRLMDVLKSCKEPTFTVSKNKLTVASNGFEGTMPLLDPEDFPVFETVTGDVGPASGIVEAWEKCKDAAANDKSGRQVLQGMHVQGDKCVATNTHFMHTWSGEFGVRDGVTIPSSLIDIVPSDATEVVIGEYIKFSNDWYEIIGPCVQGMYPNWQRVVPDSSNFRITSDSKAVTNAVRSVMGTAKDNANRVQVDARDGVMTVSARSEELGESLATVDCEGHNMLFAVNGTYLLDSLWQCEGTLSVGFNAASKPIVLTGDDDRFLSVLMPMALTEVSS